MDSYSTDYGYGRLPFDSLHSCSSQSFQWCPNPKFNDTEEDFKALAEAESQLIFDDQNQASRNSKLPKWQDMKYWVLGALVLILVRRFVERNIFQPIGLKLGIKAGKPAKIERIPCKNPRALPSLQIAYNLSSNRKLDEVQLRSLVQETGLAPREIERWMRRRRAFERPSILVKFCESGWRFTTYVASTVIGTFALWDKPWFWDFHLFWAEYPNHKVSSETWWYYLYGGSLYGSFLFTHFFDVKRKDFWEMLIHHILTIGLLVITFILNLTQISNIILLLHDCADVFMELAKMANYIKKEDLATGIFVGFTIIWGITRLWIFPVKIIYRELWLHGIEAGGLASHVGYPILGMSLTLMGLHLFWTYFICRIAWAAVFPGQGKKQKDFRSSSESSDSSSDHMMDLKEQRSR